MKNLRSNQKQNPGLHAHSADVNRSGVKRIGVSRSLVLTAAITTVLGAIAPATFAQQRVGGDGRLSDYSNRVGSGGFNDNSSSALPPGVFGNAVVSGDVTAGRGFAGNIPYFSPGAFHAILPGSFVDTFVAGSTNVQTNGTVVNNSQDVHLFLGDNRGVNPPSNFVSTGAQPGYIPNAALTDTQFTSDTRLGAPETSPISGSVPSAIFQTGGTQSGGGQSTYVTASSLFGVKTLQSAQQTDGSAQFTGNGPLNSALGSGDRVDLSADIRTQALNQLNNPDQAALSGAGLTGLPAGVASYATPNASSANGQNSSSIGSGGLPTPGSQNANTFGSNASANNTLSSNTPGNNALNGQGTGDNGQNNGAVPNGAIDASVNTQVSAAVPSGYALGSPVAASPFSGSIVTGEGSSTNIFSKDQPWNKNGSNYQQMLMRLKTINPNAALSTEQRSLLNQAKALDVKNAAQASTPKTGELRTGAPAGAGGTAAALSAPGAAPGAAPGVAPGVAPGAGVTPQAAALPVGPVVPQVSGEKSKPIPLNSFSGDAGSPEVRQHLADAEALMKQGKFTSALEEYDLVEQQSPSNPYIELGRANAELGASYYGLAEAHLRQAFMSNQALLSAQLDLHSFLGEDKLQYLVKDLKQIAQANPTESRPVFLLSYICYNTNNPRGAAAYLDLAEKREGKPDPFFKLVRQNWDLPTVGDDNGDTGLNK